MMISSYVKRIDNQDVENGLIRFFRVRIHAKQLTWIWVFFSCRYIHIVVLVYLFQRGVGRLDCFNNLGYVVFFVVYTAYEGVYRSTAGILMFFTSCFIVGQYFTSLFYQVYMYERNEQDINALYWWNFFPNRNKVFGKPLEDPFRIKPGQDIYFRCTPQLEDWINIFLMRMLKEVNIMYTKEKESEYKLREEAKHIIAEKTGKLGYYANRIRRIAMGLFNYAVIVALVLVQYITEPSIITWLFFALNLTNLAFMVRGSLRASELRRQFIISSIIKIYSLIVIIISVFILAFDYKIESKDPGWVKVKGWLQVLGLKTNEMDGLYYSEDLSDEEIEILALRYRMIAMVIFFLCSIYLCSHFSSKMKQAKEDEDFGENDYKKLFEFRADKRQDESDEDEADRIDKDGLQESIYKKRKYYTATDLIDFYEGVRFTLPFMVYRKIKWWNTIDIMAKYANIFVTGIYVYVAFFVSVDLWSCVNLFLLGAYFSFVTRQVGRRAEVIQKVSGVQSQCDV
jgi:hypothetical protein